MINWKSKKGYEALFKEHYKSLVIFANSYLKDIDQSEEIVQDVFVNLWNKRKSIDINTNPKSYLYASVRNVSLNTIKHNKYVHAYMRYNQEQISINEQHEADTVVASEMEEKIADVIAKMPPERKKIFLMSRNEGLKYREISEKLNISVKTVENQMGKALKYLREELAEYLGIIIFAIMYFISGGKL